MWDVKLSARAEKDKKLLKRAGLEEKARQLLKVLSSNPFQNPPPYEKLIGDMNGSYSRRINISHRLVYEVDKENQIVYILMMWSHYGD